MIGYDSKVSYVISNIRAGSSGIKLGNETK